MSIEQLRAAFDLPVEAELAVMGELRLVATAEAPSPPVEPTWRTTNLCASQYHAVVEPPPSIWTDGMTTCSNGKLMFV